LASTRITILYDNDATDDRFETGWGFSCLVERGAETVLFDTGWDGDQLISNARLLGVELEKVRTIFISHDHWDHMGGLARALTLMSKPKVYVPASVSRRLKQEISERADVVPVLEETEIGDGLWSTGEMGSGMKEQSLLMEVEGGWAVLTGCAHQGLENILARARQKGRVRAVIGGFHGFQQFEELEPVEELFPCHCTMYKKDIAERYPDKTGHGGVGKVIEL
jgi:7,8-dihydropterin-6-yl-methyl-4-(beta-D-ribofuranosyl)aminobenzene 5'-phosphate synthase